MIGEELSIETGVLQTPEQAGVNRCRNTERILQEQIVQELRSAGYLASTEYPMAHVNGRADILALAKPSAPVYLIEVKTSDPLKGVGQLLAYGSSGWPHHPRLVLALPDRLVDRMLRAACEVAGIYLWRGNPPKAKDLSEHFPDEHSASAHDFGIERISALNGKRLVDCDGEDLTTLIDTNERRSRDMRFNMGAYFAFREQLIARNAKTVRELYAA